MKRHTFFCWIIQNWLRHQARSREGSRREEYLRSQNMTMHPDPHKIRNEEYMANLQVIFYASYAKVVGSSDQEKIFSFLLRIWPNVDSAAAAAKLQTLGLLGGRGLIAQALVFPR